MREDRRDSREESKADSNEETEGEEEERGEHDKPEPELSDEARGLPLSGEAVARKWIGSASDESTE